MRGITSGSGISPRYGRDRITVKGVQTDSTTSGTRYGIWHPGLRASPARSVAREQNDGVSAENERSSSVKGQSRTSRRSGSKPGTAAGKDKRRKSSRRQCWHVDRTQRVITSGRIQIPFVRRWRDTSKPGPAADGIRDRRHRA